MDAVLSSQKDYGLQWKANIIILIFSMIISLLVGFIALALKDQLTAFYFNKADSVINGYFENGTNYGLVIYLSIILNTADIL